LDFSAWLVPLMFPAGREAQARGGGDFSWIVYKSRAHRDQVNETVMGDPQLASMMDPKALPFDGMRMIWGGLKTLLEV
jgi:uncharacterized protein YbaA (DUF1428 family)